MFSFQINTVGICKWSKKCWGVNNPYFQKDLKAQPFEIRTKMSGFQIVMPQLEPDHLNSDLHKVQISNVSVFQMVKFQIPSMFENLTTGHVWTIQLLDLFGIQMVIELKTLNGPTVEYHLVFMKLHSLVLDLNSWQSL